MDPAHSSPSEQYQNKPLVTIPMTLLLRLGLPRKIRHYHLPLTTHSLNALSSLTMVHQNTRTKRTFREHLVLDTTSWKYLSTSLRPHIRERICRGITRIRLNSFRVYRIGYNSLTFFNGASGHATY